MKISSEGNSDIWNSEVEDQPQQAEAQNLPKSASVLSEAEAWDLIMNSEQRPLKPAASSQSEEAHAKKRKRWNVEDDQNLCRVITQLESEGRFNLQEILSLHPEDFYLSCGLKILSKILEWKNPLKNLAVRIQKLYSKSLTVDTFSKGVQQARTEEAQEVAKGLSRPGDRLPTDG